VYLEHFGLAEAPFRITPHPDFFFDGADRGATLDALIYAVLHEEGIVKVSGEVGSGKTMLCRVLMERLPAHVDTIYLATPSIARDEILHAIADELKLEFSGERTGAVLRALQEHLIGLYGAGRRVVILIDEAHGMPDETLEQVRLLSNLESTRHKLLQIVLFGQPELDQTLAKPSMRQLKDRITHSFRMRPLSEPEVGKYIDFRMRAAGYRGPELFAPRAIAMIARASSGLTRRINILADKSLLAAFTENAHSIAGRQVRAAISDSEFTPLTKSRRPAKIVAAAVAAGALLGAGLHWALRPAETRTGPKLPVPTAPPSAQAARPPLPSTDAAKSVTNLTAPAAALASSAAAPATTMTDANSASQKVPGAQSAVAADKAPERTLASSSVAAAAAVPSPPAPTAASRLSREQLQRIAGYSTANQRLLAERIAATRNLLEQAPDEAFSVELFITENIDPARMERFLLRARDLVPLSEVYVIPVAGGGTYRIRVVFGAFASRDEAKEAERRLPPKYQREFNTSLRSISDLRRPL
jgi:MSHA biogenesis protein MshM